MHGTPEVFSPHFSLNLLESCRCIRVSLSSCLAFTREPPSAGVLLRSTRVNVGQPRARVRDVKRSTRAAAKFNPISRGSKDYSEVSTLIAYQKKLERYEKKLAQYRKKKARKEAKKREAERKKEQKEAKKREKELAKQRKKQKKSSSSANPKINDSKGSGVEAGGSGSGGQAQGSQQQGSSDESSFWSKFWRALLGNSGSSS